ncbi:MAG: CRTAC1 family protein [Isosphaeraceae bacterium]
MNFIHKISLKHNLLLMAFCFMAMIGCGKQKTELDFIKDDSKTLNPKMEIHGANEIKSATGEVIVFQDVAKQAGLIMAHYPAAKGEFRLFETMGSGVGLIDFDNDGLLDIYIGQGADVPYISGQSESRYNSRLYRNLGEMKFEDVTLKAGVGFGKFAEGIAVGDYDGDGDEDLYVAGFHSAALFQNQGNGTFREVTASAGLVNDGWATSCAFADFDKDGDLDLYVVRYLSKTVDIAGRPTVKCNALPGQSGYCPPLAHQPEADSLYKNNGDGTFTDIGNTIGLSPDDGNGLGLAVADYDGDLLPDIFIANDKSQCRYYKNLGKMQFEERGLESGLAFNESGEPTAAMGVATGDIDQNGTFDILVTNFYEEGVTLFNNLGKGQFDVATSRARLKIPTKGMLGFGTGFHDFDNDGLLDLFITNGHVNDVRPLRMPYQMNAQLFRNSGQMQFQEITQSAGEYFQQKWLGRGAAFGDLNNDGLLDIVISHNDGPPTLLLNKTVRLGNHFIGLKLVPAQNGGRAVSPIGSVIKLKLEDGRTLTRAVTAGTSYLSSHDQRLICGTGKKKISEIEIHWPNGKVETRKEIEMDKFIILNQKVN